MNEFIWDNTFNSGDEVVDTFSLAEEAQDVFDFVPAGFDVITPYYRPDAQLSDSTGRGTVATQRIGGIKPSNYGVLINNVQTNVALDPSGNQWEYDAPLWFGPNSFRVTLYDPAAFDYVDVFAAMPGHTFGGEINDTFSDGDELQDTFDFAPDSISEAVGPDSQYLYGLYSYVQSIFLERVYLPKQVGVTVLDGYSDIEGTYYEDEGYGATPDAYGSTKVLYACGQTQFPSRLRVKYITNRGLTSGVIYNGTEPDGYSGYKLYFGESPLFDDHVDSIFTDTDGFEHYFTTRTDGIGDGYGVFRNPLRRYGTRELVVVDGYEQLSIVPNSKYDVYDEAENQVFTISHAINEGHILYEGQTVVYLTKIPEALDEIQIFKEIDSEIRTPAAYAVDFDPTRMMLTMTPFDSDGYGSLIARIIYTYRGVGTTVNNPDFIHDFPNEFRTTPDGYSVNEDLLERDSLEFDFANSLRWKADTTVWTPLTEIPDYLTDITFNTQGQSVIVGDAGDIYWSNDRLTWAIVYSSSRFDAVLYKNGIYVAVGTGGKICISLDGINWTPQTSGITDDLEDVHFANGLWVVVGNNGAILTSPNGITWTAQTSGVSDHLYSVIYTQGKFVVVGGDLGLPRGIVLTSSNGISWSLVFIENLDVRFNSVTSGNGILITTGKNGRIYKATAPDGPWTYIATPVVVTNLWVNYNDYQFVLVGGPSTTGTLYTSDDGITWTVQNARTTGWLEYVEFYNNKWYAVGEVVLSTLTRVVRNYETELLDNKTTQKLRMAFFKQNGFEIEAQLSPGFDILSSERIARVGNDLNDTYYDNGKREIIIQTDYRGLDLEVI